MKRNKKGFTLAELLVVVAIIAVLVAIAIPIFTAATAKAEEAVEVANARSTYAEGMVAVVDGSYSAAITKTYSDKDYTFTYTAPATAGADGIWSVAVAKTSTGKTAVYNTAYTNADSGKDFSEVTINGKAGD